MVVGEVGHLLKVALVALVEGVVRGGLVVDLAKDAHALVENALDVVGVQNVVGLLVGETTQAKEGGRRVSAKGI